MKKTFRVLQFFCGAGGKGLGAKEACAQFGDYEATFETIGGIDFDPLACRDFEMLVGAPTLCVDVHDLEPDQLRAFAGDEAPDAVMMSPPCKGFSGLLSAKRAAEETYQRMNTLMLRALFLLVSTWPRMPKLVFIENVPLIRSRGREIVRKSRAILESHGFVVAEGNHDCGELGGLAQHRPRYFMMARHREQVPHVLYEPPKHRVRACGEVLGPMPIPGDVESAGPMHSMPKLWWRNWLRLAEIPAGGDWRDVAGVLADGEKRREKFRRAAVTPWDASAETVTGPGGSAPSAVADPRFSNIDRVTSWDKAIGTVTSKASPASGGPVVADPRFTNVMQVAAWDEPTRAVIGVVQIGSGALSVADPRWGGGRLGVTGWNEAAATVTGESLPSNGRNAVADPRIPRNDDLGVLDWSEPSGVVTGDARPRKGRFAVADPRFVDGKKKNWQQVSGVTPWTSAAPTVISNAKLHAGAFQVADPRVGPHGPRYRVLTLAEAYALELPPDKSPSFIPIIVAADGTWHRPLTTLELAALQSLPIVFNGKPLVLAGNSHTRWRQAIGNLVPPLAALGIAGQLLRTLLISFLGAFTLDNNNIWVAPERRMHAAGH